MPRRVCFMPLNPTDLLLSLVWQRGDGVFDKSIRALKLLNSLGYGSQRQ